MRQAPRPFSLSDLPHNRSSDTKLCECEHQEHFDQETTNAGAAHRYGRVPATTTVTTEYGTFASCAHCAEHHFGRSEK